MSQENETRDSRTLALAQALCDLDDDIIEEAHADKPRRRPSAVAGWVAAACVVLVVGSALATAPLWALSNGKGESMNEEMEPFVPGQSYREEYGEASVKLGGQLVDEQDPLGPDLPCDPSPDEDMATDTALQSETQTQATTETELTQQEETP